MKNLTNGVFDTSNLDLKYIPNVGFDFNDVIENVEKLIDNIFPIEKDIIKKTVEELSIEYSEQIDDDYEIFMYLGNETESFKKWVELSRKLTKELDEPVSHLLDLYFQINMMNNYDIFDDLLIHAYLEDVQPFIEMQ
ncbi:MAG: hypothetical protein ACK5A2_02760 [Bacteroidota bacterium]|jgi:hypothetical protein